MRVLFMFLSGFPHFGASISLAWGLRSAGHDVRYTGTGPRIAAVPAAGLPIVDTGLPGVDTERVMLPKAADDATWTAQMARLMDPAKVVDAKDAARVASAFVNTAELTKEGDLAAARRWRPDLIVHEPAHLGAPFVATAIGVPRVQLEIHMQGIAKYFTPNVDEWLAEYHGVDRIEPSRAHISMAPASFAPRPPDSWAMRYVPYNGGGVIPDWATEPAARPRVCLTLGSIIPGTDGLGHLVNVVEQCGRVDAEFVLAAGDGDVASLGELPPNVRVADWVPLRELLPTCAAVVHHGGDGTMCTAMVAGVPQLIMPHGTPHQVNAQLIAGRGMGLDRPIENFRAEDVAALIGDDKYRIAAAEVRAEIHAMPAPADVVPRLVELAD